MRAALRCGSREHLDDKGYLTRKDRKALIEAAEREPLYPSDFDGARR
jgi:hypothetical protein